MRVLILSQYYPPEPAGLIAQEVAQHLASKGNRVVVVAGMPNYPEGRIYNGFRRWAVVREEGASGEAVVRVPLYPYHGRSAFKRMINYMSFSISSFFFSWGFIRRSDVVYVYGSPVTAGLPPAIWRTISRRDIRLVVHAQDIWPESVSATGFVPAESLRGRLVQGIATCLARYVYGSAARIIAICHGAKRHLSSRSYLPGDRVSVIYNWADESRRPILHPTCASGPLRIMYAGNVGAAQGLEFLVRAVKLANESGISVQLDIVGSGSEVDTVREAAADALGESIAMHPRMDSDQLADLQDACDLHVVSLQDEPVFSVTVPGKLQQLLYQGAALLCISRGDVATITKESGAGWVTALGDERGALEVFQEAYAERHSLASKGMSGSEYYRVHMGCEKSLEKIEEVLTGAARSSY